MATFVALVSSGTPAPHVFPFLIRDFTVYFSPDAVSLVGASVTPGSVVVSAVQAVDADASTVVPGNWTLAMRSPATGVTPTITLIVVVGSTITFTTSEQTTGQLYRLTAGALAGGVIEGSYVDFTGVGIAPNVAGASVTSQSLGETTIRITFSEGMLTTGLSSTSTYTVASTNGGAVMNVISATPEAVANPTYVDLVLRGGTPGKAYTVTVDA